MIRRHAIAGIALGTALVAAGCASDQQAARPQNLAQPVALDPAQAARSNIAIAEGYDESHQWRGAIRHYELARRQDPSADQWVARRLAVLYARVGEEGRAFAEYEKAYRLDPNDAELLAEIGAFDYATGRFDRAEQVLRGAVAIRPDLRDAWFDLGMTLAAQERYREAFEAMANAMSPAESRANIALVMARNGNEAGARATLREAVREQPELKRYTVPLDAMSSRQSDAPARDN